eukprot:SAG22_NODE_5842_length_944_cov_2.063905_2_plen_122_part_00
MPNAVQCSVAAGTAVVWDNALWHCATANLSGRERVGHIAGFGAITDRLGALQIPPRHLATLEAEGRLPAGRKAAFGLELTAAEQAELAQDWGQAEQWIKQRTGGWPQVGAGPVKTGAVVTR